MNGILYVFHGSQQQDKNQAARLFIEQLHKKIDKNKVVIERIAFLENHEWTIAAQLEELCKQTLEQIIVVPMLLFPAHHAMYDIPCEVAKIQEKFPDQSIKMAQTFGNQPEITEILADRLSAAKQTAAVVVDGALLVSHGTKRTDIPQRQLEKIAETLAKKSNLWVVPTSLKGSANIYEQLEREEGWLEKNWLVLPFFLYDGFLVQKLKKTMDALPGTFIFATPLNFDEQMIPAVLRVIEESEEV